MRMRRMGLIVLGVTVAMAGCKKAPKSDDNKRAKKGSGQAAAPVKPVMDGPVPADAMGALDKHADKTPTPSSPAVGGAVAAMPGPSDQRAKPTAGAGPVNPNAGAMVGKPDPRIMPLGSGPVNPNDPNAVAVMKPGPGPKAIMTSVTVKGGLKTAIVRRVIRRHLVELAGDGGPAHLAGPGVDFPAADAGHLAGGVEQFLAVA